MTRQKRTVLLMIIPMFFFKLFHIRAAPEKKQCFQPWRCLYFNNGLKVGGTSASKNTFCSFYSLARIFETTEKNISSGNNKKFYTALLVFVRESGSVTFLTGFSVIKIAFDKRHKNKRKETKLSGKNILVVNWDQRVI